VHKNKVLVSVVFRGREIAHIQDEGQRIVQFIIKNLEDIARVETPPNTQGKRITCVLSPK
jgi:translation initiation factor IF-3